ncbi:helix-turn-helix domain-containing protein [Paenibacillus sp. 1P03SA]|uniref:helix-turn-helix domain-containing protein n=1 Tax=Paenibacillus sp. 1P03SA TaxID=3132294 RepID=UPI0039A05CC6
MKEVLSLALRIGRSRLPELLGSKGMTQAQLAQRLNLSDSFVSKVVHGERRLSLVKTREAAIILNCYMDDLYEWTDTQEDRRE